MKWKNIIPTKSPVGWVMLAGITLLSTSPTARQKVRQLAVKGTSTFIGLSNKLTKRDSKQENEYQFDFLNGKVENQEPPKEAHMSFVSAPIDFSQSITVDEESEMNQLIDRKEGDKNENH